MVKILHFSDAHIDMVRQGRRDPQSGLPLRSLDFLHALDTIIETAVAEKAELVIFSGDAYRNQLPAPTFQREWEARILKLSQAGIFTILVVGNHDFSPAAGRAHAMQEFETLAIPNTYVVREPCLLKPEDLNGLPVQVIGLPWISHSGLLAYMETLGKSLDEVHTEIEDAVIQIVENLKQGLDPSLPAVLTAHISVGGAVFSSERSVMLGRDLIIPPGVLKDERLDYIALGHIHKFQDLNAGHYPPVVYAGSIEKMNFGEMDDTKGFVLADVERKKTTYTFHPLRGRKFLATEIELEEQDGIADTILKKMYSQAEMKDAVYRLRLHYPRKWEPLIDERPIREYADGAFEFYLERNPYSGARVQLSEEMKLAQTSPIDLLDVYWKSNHIDDEGQVKELQRMAAAIMNMYDRKGTTEELLKELKSGEKDA